MVDKIKEANHILIDRKLCKDNKDEIVVILKEWLTEEKIDVIITRWYRSYWKRYNTRSARGNSNKHIPGFGEIFKYKLKNC